MKSIVLFVVISVSVFWSCQHDDKDFLLVRKPVDSIGFPTNQDQVLAFMKQMDLLYGDEIKDLEESLSYDKNASWKTIIAPHDDYAYVQYLYPAALKNLKVKTVFIIGVAHKARQFELADRIVFDSFEYWDAPMGKVRVSELRTKILESLDTSFYTINDSMHSLEHSVEAFLPVLQYYNTQIEIIPILVPYMSFNRMVQIARPLSELIHKTALENDMVWGKDFAIIISNDAVHCGDIDWGDKDFAYFGNDSIAYLKTKVFEKQIIEQCFLNGLSMEKIKRFVDYTVMENDYREYKYTWCGRYSVPFGLLVSLELKNLYNIDLKDYFIGYSTSIDKAPLDTTGLGIGFTAPANLRHWVGYASLAYQ
jgi:AmmeMemoRadiSam system protein B